MSVRFAMVALVGLVFAAQLSAQEFPPMEEAGPEHEWLKKFVGEWELSSESPKIEGQPQVDGTGVMRSSMLGKLWLVNSSDHEVSGMKLKSIQMIGYDTKKKKYVGIWVDSMTNYMWHYEGTVDKAGKKLTLQADGPSMSGDGKMATYRDMYEFKDADTIHATSAMQDEVGKWKVIMEGTAKRKK